MTTSTSVIPVQEANADPRVRIFRRSFQMADGSEAMDVDAYVILTERYLVVCDTLLCPADVGSMLQSLAAEATGRQVLVINSHADWDHCWGNNYFMGTRTAPIIAQQYGLTRVRSEEARERLTNFQQRSPLFQTVVLTEPTITFERSMAIHGGDLTLELFSAPGHQPDHLALWIPELRLLLAFDAVEIPLPSIENAASAPYMFATLEQFLTLEPAQVYCSHGKTTGVAMIHSNLAYLREIERRCQSFLKRVERQPDKVELEHSDALINYPFEEVIADLNAPVDEEFYTWAHQNNIRCIMQWLCGQTA